MKLPAKSFACALWIFLALCSVWPLIAQEPEGDLDEARKAKAEADLKEYEAQLKRLEVEAKLRELEDPNNDRNSDAEAELKEYEARLKRAEIESKMFETGQKYVTALSSSASAENMTVENEITAFGSWKCLAPKIWSKLPANEISTLIVYDDKLAGSVAAYRLTLERIHYLSIMYESAFQGLQSGGSPRLSGAIDELLSVSFAGGEIAALAVNALSLFKTEITMKGGTVTGTKDSFISSFAGERPSTHKAIAIYYPERMIPVDVAGSPIVRSLRALQRLNTHAQALEPLYKLEAKLKERKTLEAAIANTTDSDDLAKLTEKLKKLQEDIAKLKSEWPGLKDDVVLEEVGKLRKADIGVEAISSGLGLNIDGTAKTAQGGSLVDFLRAEMVNTHFQSDDSKTYWFDLSMTKAGGTVKTKKNAIVGLFNPSGQITFSGGSVVSYAVFDRSGRIAWSGTEGVYTPFRKTENIANVQCSQ